MNRVLGIVSATLVILTVFFSSSPAGAGQSEGWLKDYENIRVGVPAQLAPLVSIENGQAEGLDVDLMKKFTRGLPAEIVWKPCGSWLNCLQAIKDKEIDVLSSVSYSVERNQFMDFTQSYWSMPWAAISLSSPQSNSGSIGLAQLKNSKVGVVKGYSITSQLSQLSGIQLVQVDGIREGMSLLRSSTVDYYVDSLPMLVHQLQERPLPGSELSVIDDAKGEKLYLAIRDDWQPLVMALNRGIDSVTENERRQLRQKWYGFQLEQGWSNEELLDIAMKVGSIVLLVIVGFVIWNSRLRKEIKLRKAAERRIRHIATHDELTGLPNRNLMQDRLEQTLNQNERTGKPFAVLFLDLDGFKKINDDFGHNYGDELLIHAAQRMSTLLRRSDTVCRHGGDEFVIILPTANTTGSALAVSRKLVVQLAKPYKVKKKTLEISVSIGVAVYPKHGKSTDDLLRSADKAMYRAKAAGKNDVRLAGDDG
ncbi:diguanylate cyclase domain-containing protein [Idiomarina sp. HP20-50]|uniref:diguanylate cyclase domain-containing protein n=1 Tax=Idiomarina sp. HP20-50 TaxID=3070813 RepID=UPI00294B481E|nr:diguanylate cyclase [Idiomarina sp. HP20-50]MDV6316919.1 diguanylate cyclase [Idiomarina sp. HP20-50]